MIRNQHIILLMIGSIIFIGCMPNRFLQEGPGFNRFALEESPEIGIISDYAFGNGRGNQKDLKLALAIHKATIVAATRTLEKKGVHVSHPLISLSGCCYMDTSFSCKASARHYPDGMTMADFISGRGINDSASSLLCRFSSILFQANQRKKVVYMRGQDTADIKYENNDMSRVLLPEPADSGSLQQLRDCIKVKYALFVLTRINLVPMLMQAGSALATGLLSSSIVPGISIIYPVSTAEMQCVLIDLQSGEVLWNNREMFREKFFEHPSFFKRAIMENVLLQFPDLRKNRGKF